MGFTLEAVKYRHILDIPALTIPDRQVTCLVGESGSGKTTLLRLLNNLISPDQGRVLYNGQDVEDLDPLELRRRVLMLPQAPSVFPGTVADNLRLGCELSEAPPPDHCQLAAALSLAKLDKPLDADAENLSGGEKQRLALARVLLLQPEVLLLDEPSTALDEETERLVLEGVVGFARRKEIALVMVTHATAVAGVHGDTVITVQGGRVANVRGRADHE
jgi:putative ABC transport system ATP-binding protein